MRGQHPSSVGYLMQDVADQPTWPNLTPLHTVDSYSHGLGFRVLPSIRFRWSTAIARRNRSMTNRSENRSWATTSTRTGRRWNEFFRMPSRRGGGRASGRGFQKVSWLVFEDRCPGCHKQPRPPGRIQKVDPFVGVTFWILPGVWEAGSRLQSSAQRHAWRASEPRHPDEGSVGIPGAREASAVQLLRIELSRFRGKGSFWSVLQGMLRKPTVVTFISLITGASCHAGPEESFG